MIARTVGALAVGAAAALAAGAIAVRAPRPRTTNHRGTEIPVTLGVAFVLAVLAGTAVGALEGIAGSIVAGVLLVSFAGFLDDWRGSEARGIRAHLGSLIRGRFTTGILKIFAGFAGGLLVALALGGPTTRQLLGVILIAAATNLGNVLDVAPGRALKAFVPLQSLVLFGVWGSPLGVLVAASVGAALGILPFDLRERGMLGDAGSNPVGFLAGVGAYVAFPQWALVVALVGVLGLQALAETVTLSRVIESVPPLRGYDRLGRVPGTKTSRKPGDQS